MKIYTNLTLSPEELRAVTEEHQNATYLLLRQTLIPVFIWPVLMVIVFWQKVDPVIAFSWLGAFLLVLLSRHYLVYYWYKPKHSDLHDRILERGVLGLTFVASCLWGLAMTLMDFDNRAAESVFLSIIVCSLITASIGVASYWVQYFWAYGFPMFTFFTLNFFMGVPEPHFMLGLGAILFGVFTKHIIYVFYRKSIENIVLNSRNQDMAKSLENQIQKAEELAASRSHFLASASHDLRQPLQAMNLFLAALKPHLNSIDSEAIFAKLENSSDDMNELLSSMLDISRLDSQTMHTDIKAVNLDHLLENLEERFRVQAESKGLRFTFNKTHSWVESDPILLGRILSNLLSNAINYTQQGEISICSKREGDETILHIQDTGQGVSNEQQALIFDEFYQVGNPERDRKKGLGLGLSIVKRLCLLLDIPMVFESELGQGSRFILRLKQASRHQAAAAPAPNTKPWELTGSQVLIIEDEDAVRDSLATLFKQWGCQVIAAESANHGIDQLNPDFQLDLIISDLRLRDNKTGIEAIAGIHQYLACEKIPSLIISGDTAPERLKEVANSGHPMLHKPVKPMQLRAAAQRLLAK